MKIAVFSDSHWNISDMCNILSRETFDTVIHLGDCVRDAEDLSMIFQQQAMIRIAGNNDLDSDLPFTRLAILDGVKFYLTHGHLHPARNRAERIARDAAAVGASCALYGHTHVKNDVTIDGVRVLNPGSISLPRDRTKSWIRMELKAGEINSVEFIVE